MGKSGQDIAGLVFMGLGSTLVAFGARKGREDAAFLREWLARTLELDTRLGT